MLSKRRQNEMGVGRRYFLAWRAGMLASVIVLASASLAPADSDCCDSAAFTIDNGGGDLPPVADAGGPYFATAYLPITFDGSRSSDPDGDIVRYDWKFFSGDDWHNDVGPVPSTTYVDPDTYAVTLRVHDDGGAIDTAAATVTVSTESLPPIAFIDSVTPNPAQVGQSVSFQGHGWDPLGSAITGWQWDSDIDGSLSNSASFSTSSLSVGMHTIQFKVKNDYEIWSEEVPYTLIVSTQADFGRTDVTPPYKGAWVTDGGGSIIGGVSHAANVMDGCLAVRASAGLVGGVFAEAWQQLSFHIRKEKTIGINAELWIVHGNPGLGYAAFSSTSKIWWIDHDHDQKVDSNEFHKVHMDPPLTTEQAVVKVIQLASLYGGFVGGPAQIGKAIDWIGRISNIGGFVDQLYNLVMMAAADEETINFWFTSDAGRSHTVGMGVRCDVAACVTGAAFPIAAGRMNNVKVWGIYPPGPPDLTGPEPPVGYVGVSYDFTATAVDVNTVDDVCYMFDWDDVYAWSWGAFVPNGTPVMEAHAWEEPGEYAVVARAWDGDSIHIIGDQLDMISPDSAPYTMLITDPNDVVFTALGDVDLEITNPQGRMVSKGRSDLSTAEYVEKDLNGDGLVDDRVLIRDAVPGVYTIQVWLEPTAVSRSNTFRLYASWSGRHTTLARDIPMSEINGAEYRFIIVNQEPTEWNGQRLAPGR